MKRIVVLSVTLFLLLLFILLSKFEDRQVVRDFDFAVTVKVQEAIDHSSRLRLKAVVGNILEGSVFFAGPLVTSLAMILLTGFMFRKRKMWAFLIPFGFALIIGVELVAKDLVHHPPPPFFMIKNPSSVFPKYYVSEEFSFPSGHAARAVFLSLVCYSLFTTHSAFRRKIVPFLMFFGLLGYVTLVGVSKVYLGHHWLSDVVGGILLGVGIGVLTAEIRGKYNTRTMSD